jgi:hypothetical protein
MSEPINPYEPPHTRETIPVLRRVSGRAGWIEGILVGIVLPAVFTWAVFFIANCLFRWHYGLEFRWY